MCCGIDPVLLECIASTSITANGQEYNKLPDISHFTVNEFKNQKICKVRNCGQKFGLIKRNPL